MIVVNHRRLQPLDFGSGEGQTRLLNGENLFARPGGAPRSRGDITEARNQHNLGLEKLAPSPTPGRAR